MLLIWLVPSQLSADEASDSFDAAIELMTDEQPREAAEALVRVADSFPQHSLADDSLFQAGELFEQSLGEPARAVALYRRLVEDYPDSRLALAANERLAALASRIDEAGDAVLAAFVAIKNARAELGAAQAIRRAEALLADNPDWSGVGELALWLGGEYERATRWTEAARAYGVARAQSADPVAAVSAGLAAARLATHRGRFDDAERVLESIDTAGRPERAQAVADVRAALDAARGRSTLSIAALIVSVLAIAVLFGSLRTAASSWGDTARALARPPTEVLYLAPVSALLIAASATGFPEIAWAVVAICTGGLGVTWLSGAGLRLRRTRTTVIVHALSAAAAIGCICYIALYRAQLLDLLARTVQFGPDV